jgi:hypothetical protein
MYYWGTNGEGLHHICMAEADPSTPEVWEGRGAVLGPAPEFPELTYGPSFPHILQLDETNWIMYIVGWGIVTEEKPLPNTTWAATSSDGGLTWAYHGDTPIIPCDQPYDGKGSGSLSVIEEDGLFHMYYTAIQEYTDIPEGVETSHDPIPIIGVAHATSKDGLVWEMPRDDFLVPPRWREAPRFEYIASKPYVTREGDKLRMWISSASPCYRLRSLTGTSPTDWTWDEDAPLGLFGLGEEGAFDDQLYSYASVLEVEDRTLMWYTGNWFGNTGMGLAERVQE